MPDMVGGGLVGGLDITIADRIEAEIRAGDLQPGDRLKSRRQLAATYLAQNDGETLPVSEATVYAALVILKDRGLVYGEQGRGIFVATPDRWAPPRTT